ncbi:MAG: UvrD-helicase domain-containing protein [Acidobacteriia bacterium]|nr:UvrD-helicase domain-containing protein [Terriglobia bacterium]
MSASKISLSVFNDLNPDQRKAVELVEGPLLILAGAGSGKTRVITYRISHLIEGCGVRPENILAVTFTNKAADQMKERVFKLLQGRHSGRPLICTFHSLCVRILRREIENLKYSRDFTIYDESDQESLMKACIKEVGLDSKAVTPRSVMAQVSYAKNQSISPEAYYAMASDPRREQAAILYELYEKKLKRANALDFDDLLLRTVELLGGFPEVRDRYNEKFQYILVDEYQDTNQSQYRIIRHLTRARQNLCVVGDEDQSIYRWRGADIQNILNFELDYPNATLIKLEQNYRSTQVILDAAGAVVSNNVARKGKSLWTERKEGERLGFFEAPDAESEALFVANRMQVMRTNRGEAKCAILYRTNAQSRSFEEAFRRLAIPYHMVGGFSFYDRAEIKDILSYLRFCMNPEDSVSLERIINTPARGIGRSTWEGIGQLARDQAVSFWKAIGLLMERQTLSERGRNALKSFQSLVGEIQEKLEVRPLPDLIRFILEASGYRQMLQDENTDEARSRIENLNELMNAAADAAEREETLREFLDRAALVSDQDSFDERAGVSLMTIHSAKGLEFPVVFVVGLEEGLFPHSRSLVTEEDLEEERRLFYVAMTRAQDQLFLSRVRMRRFYGAESYDVTEPSRFLNEIPSTLVEDLSAMLPGSRFRRVYEGPTYNTVDHIKEALRGRGKDLAGVRSAVPSSFSPRSKPGVTKWKSKFQLGSQVRHPKYGIGTVLRSEGEGDTLKLSVNFRRYGLKKLIEKFAGLEEAEP